MSFWKRLCGGANSGSIDHPGIGPHLEYLEALRLPAIKMAAAFEPRSSRVGGLPSLPDEIPWPEWKGEPLAFLCQLDLRDIPDGCDRHELPSSGMLFVFYSQQQETWGFDPKDRGSWRVIWTETPRPEDDPARVPPPGLHLECSFPEKPIVFTPITTYPDWQDEAIERLDLDETEGNEYIELCSGVFEGEPEHHLFGHPSPVQNNDMDLECQLVSNGLYCGDATGYENPMRRELELGRHDWLLLLQLDTDDDVGMMWGDCGKLYFWIQRDDLREGRFENCWMILQCG